MNTNSNSEALVSFNRKTDFEKNLFLKRQVKELQEEIKRLKSDSRMREREVEIGMLKSEIEELKHDLREKPVSYDSLSPKQKKKMRYTFKDQIVEKLQKHLTCLQDSIVRKNARISELETKLKNQNQ